MEKYHLTNKAVEDLSKIWTYTFEFWSENQADIYYQELLSMFQKIANNPNLGKSYESVSKNLKGFKSNRHIIFYRIGFTNQIEVLRILHVKMDLKKRILE